MPTYDLSRLTPSLFERLVRALAFAEMGPGGTTFPPGPDGARDFSYSGMIRGFESRGWNGYLVLQSKYKSKTDDPKNDVEWLIRQLAAELSKYKDKERDLRRPDYYLLATNISLSGVSGKRGKQRLRGGHEKISAALDEWKKLIGVRDFHIWSGDQIVDLLARHPTIRQTYAAWVTSGDVLSAMLNELHPRKGTFAQIIRRALSRKLAADQYIPLNEAGSVDSKKLQTSKVFIDLPVTTPANDIAQTPQQKKEFVSSVIELARDRLDPDSGKLSRIVLLGGPGQGKSTTALFAIQLLRATILKQDPISETDPTIRDVITDILKRAANQGLPTTLPRRFPVHISLPAFADSISSANSNTRPPPSILQHIAEEFSRASDSTIDREDLRSWLGLYPWFVIMDGLDEVPPSGERPGVIEAINNFVSEIADAKADVLLGITSRPQGYNKDLADQHWAHWHLTPLEHSHVISYGQALSEAQHPFDKDRQQKIIVALKRAINEPTTARLMVSPLQVTVMHVIVDGGGSAPVGRWALFNEYFQVLKKREKAKGGRTNDVLERNWDHLDPLHHQAGLILQTESETSGGAGAHFTSPRLRLLIDKYLRDCGYSSGARAQRAEELAELALHRLVLLSTRQQGRTEDEGLISFDIRSLQEFMAAAQLTTESDWSEESDESKVPTIEDRLTHIAGVSHWRHVFLIAASRCFSDTALHHLRSAVVGIPRTLDIGDEDRFARTGARLALDMLSDGIGANHPISRYKLTENALELLELGAGEFDDRLISTYADDTAHIYERILRARLHERKTPASRAAWRLILALRGNKEDQFAKIAASAWPTEPEEVMAILEAAGIDAASKQFEHKACWAVAATKPSAVQTYLGKDFANRGGVFDKFQSNRRKGSTLHQVRPLFVRSESKLNTSIRFLTDLKLHMEIIVRTAAKSEPSFAGTFLTDKNAHPQWKLITELMDGQTLTPTRLATFLRGVAANDALADLNSLHAVIPWPAETLLNYSQDRGHLSALADKVEQGELGNSFDWASAERRWLAVGLQQSDFMVDDPCLPFNKKIATVGAPLLKSWSTSGAKDVGEMPALLNLVKNLPNLRARRQVADLAIVAYIVGPENDWLGSDFLKLLELGGTTDYGLAGVLRLDPRIWAKDDQVARILKLIAGFTGYRYNFGDKHSFPHIPLAFNRNPQWRSLLPVICVEILQSTDAVAADLTKLHASATEFRDGDGPSILSAVSAFRVLTKKELTAEEAFHLLGRGGEPYGICHRVLSCEYIPRATREELAVTLIIGGESRGQDVIDLRIALKRLLDARESRLAEEKVWVKKLRLPTGALDVMHEIRRN